MNLRQFDAKKAAAAACVGTVALSALVMPTFAPQLMQTAEAATLPQSNASMVLPKSDSSIYMEVGDKSTVSIKGRTIAKAKTSKKPVVGVEVSSGKLVISGKKPGKATITAMQGEQEVKLTIYVKKQGAYTLEVGAKKSVKLKGVKAATSTTTASIKKSKDRLIATGKAEGVAVAKSVLGNGAHVFHILTVTRPSVSASKAIKSVSTIGHVDIDGAKTTAVVVEYKDPVLASSVNTSTFKVTDYATYMWSKKGKSAFERGAGNNPGAVKKAYVNTKAEQSQTGGTKSGKYVVLEVNTDYMLSGSIPTYTSSMMASVTQAKNVKTAKYNIIHSPEEVLNYTTHEEIKGADKHLETVVDTEVSKLSIEGLDDYSQKVFHASNCYNEIANETQDLDLAYSIYVPQLTDADKGKVGLVLYVSDAGGMGDDPMISLTKGAGPSNLISNRVQGCKKCIVVVPQIPKSQRATNDYNCTSAAVPAMWQLLDSLTEQYKDYIDNDSIYGTGQSMGGMSVLAMAAQRDNYFAGMLVFGSQWGNNYNKSYQKFGSRSFANDSSSFNDMSDEKNWENWYYEVSDDNIMIMNCAGDMMSYGLWTCTQRYFAANGAQIPYTQFDPNATLAYENAQVFKLANESSQLGIRWAAFDGGDHNSTWKYGQELTMPYTWLLSQSREQEVKRAKLEGLSREYNGSTGDLFAGGTKGMNTAQFTISGDVAEAFPEGWTPGSANSYYAKHDLENPYK